MDVIASRWPRSRPLVLGEPDGRLLRGIAVAHLSGVPIGGEVWLSGSQAESLCPHTVRLDPVEATALRRNTPRTEARQTDTGLRVSTDVDTMDREELLELARIRGVEIPKTANRALIRQRLRRQQEG